MMLQVYLDLGNVAGLIALPSIKQLVAETDVAVSYLPIAGIVPRPLSPEPRRKADDPLAEFKHLRWQAKHRFERAELDRDCARLGLEPGKAQRVFDSKLSHQAFLWLAQHGADQVLPFVELVYAKRFQQEGTVDSETEVFAALSELGHTGFSADDESEALWQAHESAYLALGIHDSPAFVFSDETFQGRQHMPLLHWQITAAKGGPVQGPAPV